jgi:uncharacterized protein
MAKIGIISDSHDNLDKIKIAVDILNANKVDFVFHAGDFVAPFTVPVLEKLEMGFLGVFGNNDGEKKGLSASSQGKIQEGPLKLRKFGKDIILTHSLSSIASDDLGENLPDLIIYGHTHRAEILKKGKCLFINPGECGGWLHGKSTIAICDLGDLSCHILEI